METTKSLGERLNSARKAANLTILDLSVLTDISERTIIRIENGKTNAGFNTVVKLFYACGIEVNFQRQ